MINIVEIFKDIVTEVSVDVEFPINYLWGDGDYVNKKLNLMSEGYSQTIERYPFICLYSPFEEDKSDKDYYCKVELDFIIAVNTLPEYTNEERLNISFKKCLHPVYDHFIERIFKDPRFSFDYKGVIPHHYVENYRFGNNEAITPQGKMLNDRIDAIEIKRMKLIVKKPNNCKMI